MKVNLYTGDEQREYSTIAFDSSGRETDVIVRADSPVDADKRIAESMKDYNWADALPVSQNPDKVA